MVSGWDQGSRALSQMCRPRDMSLEGQGGHEAGGQREGREPGTEDTAGDRVQGPGANLRVE